MRIKKSVRVDGPDVASCICGRMKEVVVYGKFDKVDGSHDKYAILAGELGGNKALNHRISTEYTWPTDNDKA